MAMKFGLSLRNFVGPNEVPSIDELVGYAERAEELGFESLWAFDHLLLGVEPAFPILDSLSTLCAIATRTVVNAAGPWAGDVARMAGLSIPLLNSARTIVVTNPVAAIPAHYPFVEELGIEWYFRPELDGVLMGMGARRVERPEVPLDGEQVDAIVEHAVHRVPALAQASLLTAWTGVRPLSPDGRPFVGAHPRVSGYIFNCGWGGVGFIMAPLAGRMVAGLLTGGGMYTIDGHPLRADRFDRP